MKKILLIFLILIFGAVAISYVIGRKQALSAQVIKPLPIIAPLPHASNTQEELAILMAKTPEEIFQIDLGTIFLACLGGLPGTDVINLDHARTRIDALANLVKKQTDQAIASYRKANPKFQITPEFQAYIMVRTLQEEYRNAHQELSRYPVSLINEMLQRNRPDELFFHGMADQAEPPSIGNPVLFVAVGQQLGYPIKLVAAPGHLFARWESFDGKTLFDIQETSDGMAPRYHDYYRKEFATP